jgi:hypothetical protein
MKNKRDNTTSQLIEAAMSTESIATNNMSPDKPLLMQAMINKYQAMEPSNVNEASDVKILLEQNGSFYIDSNILFIDLNMQAEWKPTEYHKLFAITNSIPDLEISEVRILPIEYESWWWTSVDIYIPFMIALKRAKARSTNIKFVAELSGIICAENLPFLNSVDEAVVLDPTVIFVQIPEGRDMCENIYRHTEIKALKETGIFTDEEIETIENHRLVYVNGTTLAERNPKFKLVTD